MMTKDIIRKVRRIVAEELNISNGDISPGDDMGADSLDIVEIVMELEAEFGIEFFDEEVERFHTAQQIAEEVVHKLKENR